MYIPKEEPLPKFENTRKYAKINLPQNKQKSNRYSIESLFSSRLAILSPVTRKKKRILVPKLSCCDYRRAITELKWDHSVADWAGSVWFLASVCDGGIKLSSMHLLWQWACSCCALRYPWLSTVQSDLSSSCLYVNSRVKFRVCKV